MNALIRTARQTGLFYLGIAVSGLLSMLILRPRLFDADPAATLANLTDHEQLARSAVAVTLLIVVTQALTAVWFYRLFREVDPLAAGSIAAFGLINAVMILMGAAMEATAVELAHAPFGDAASAVQVLYLASENVWGVSALFFGLWLIPMGRCVLVSGWMPRPLGWLLVGGGVGYVVGAFVRYLVADSQAQADLLVVPATVAELWIVGYLLIRGVRRQAAGPDGGQPADQPADHPVGRVAASSAK